MGLQTTTMGSYPKPDYLLEYFRWFQTKHKNAAEYISAYTSFLDNLANSEHLKKLLDTGTREAVADQICCGIDVPSDGEIRRENYVYYHCRHLEGIDFVNLGRKMLRGVQEADVPRICGKIQAKKRFLARDWRVAQRSTHSRPVKITVPGPLTIANSTLDEYYHDEQHFCRDIADALNIEIRSLARAGCQYIQVDDPVFARDPKKAIDYGIENLERCFYKVPKHVMRILHMCCGYPNEVNQMDYPKADKDSYSRLAGALEASSIDAISLEDAHRHNDLSLFDQFEKKTIILGAVDIASTRIETLDEIVDRLRDVLEHIDAERLIVAPDCGLTMLPRITVMRKLIKLVQAAKAV